MKRPITRPSDVLDNDAGAELVVVYWELRAASGSILTCGRYRHASGEDIRLGARENPVLRLHSLSDGDTGEKVAAYWKQQMLEHGRVDGDRVTK